MATINAVLGRVVDVVIFPFSALPPGVGLAAISLVVSILVLLGFGRLSDQEALDRVKRRIHAGVYEIRLFKDDLGSIFSAQLGIFSETWTYFRLSLVPMLWMLVPIILLVTHLQFRYGYAPLEPGSSTLLRVVLTPEGSQRVAPTGGRGVALEAPEGVRVETPLMWAPTLGEGGWRIGAERPGVYDLVVRVGEEEFTKSVRVGGSTALRSPVRPSGFLGQLVWPAEEPLPSGTQVAEIRIDYADGEVSLFGWRTHWMIAFFALTMVFTLLLAKPLGVKI